MKRLLLCVLLAAPWVATAQEFAALSTSERLVYLMYGLIGFFGALAVLVFVWGFVMYLVRLGTVQRDDGIKIMEWGVGLVLTVLVLVGIFRFVAWIIG